MFSGNGTFYYSPQKIALRRQSITRADWEKLPWTGHLCLLFTRACEIGRMLAHFHKEGNIEAVEGYLGLSTTLDRLDARSS